MGNPSIGAGNSPPPPQPAQFDRSRIDGNSSAQKLAQNLQSFHENTFTRDYQNLQQTRALNLDTRQAETALASDLATLNNMQRELAHATGDTALHTALSNDSSLVLSDNNERMSSAQILQQAGGDPTHQFQYEGFRNSAGQGSDDGSQRVTARMVGEGNAGITGTSGFQGGAATSGAESNNQSSNTNAAGTMNWSASVNGTRMTGGVPMSADSAQQKQDNFQRVVRDPANATANEKANAYVYWNTLPPTQKNEALNALSPADLQRWNQIQTSGAGASAEGVDPALRNGYDNFNNIYNHFASTGTRTV